MSHSRQTEHYELPLYDGNDIINPLTDFNNANNSIDEALYNANQRSVGAETTANEAKDIAEGYDTRVSQAIQTANDAMTLANNTQDMIADDFDPNKAGGYNVGDFVIYNGKLYRFINAHTGAWDASDVQVSPVLIEAIADVVDEGKQAINDAVDEAEQEIAGQTEKVTKTQAMIAQPFDANKSGGYAVGDVVTYADKLYKFTSAHSGAWTGLDVEQVDVIDSLKWKSMAIPKATDSPAYVQLPHANEYIFVVKINNGVATSTLNIPALFFDTLEENSRYISGGFESCRFDIYYSKNNGIQLGHVTLGTEMALQNSSCTLYYR